MLPANASKRSKPKGEAGPEQLAQAKAGANPKRTEEAGPEQPAQAKARAPLSNMPESLKQKTEPPQSPARRNSKKWLWDGRKMIVRVS